MVDIGCVDIMFNQTKDLEVNANSMELDTGDKTNELELQTP